MPVQGLAYVEFSKTDEVLAAVTLTGQLLLGQAVLVKASEAEKNMQWEAQQQVKHQNQQLQQLNAASSINMPGALPASSMASILGLSGMATLSGSCRLQVNNLHPELKDSDIKALFEPFGQLDEVKVPREITGKSHGMAYVTYTRTEDAARAMTHWHGRKLADRALDVQLAAIVPPEAGTIPTSTSAAIATAIAVQPPAAVSAAAAGQVVAPGELFEDEEAGGAGLKLNAHARVALMSKLANSAGMAVPDNVKAVLAPHGHAPLIPTNAAPNAALAMAQGLLGPASPIPTPCLLLKGMFSADEAADEGFLKEMAQDVADECGRFGTLQHIFVDPSSEVPYDLSCP